jgi:CheY-like chemotaxis protein
MSQEELAERASLHRTYITDIERGARNLSLETMCKLAVALGLSIEDLFSRAEIREPHLAAPASLIDVLLVEDSPRDVELTLEAFKQARLTNRVLVVRDGAAALDFVFCRRQYADRLMGNNPQIVLLDLNLPKVQGLEVLRRIKADSQTRHIRVVVLSASKKDEDIEKALALGAEAYLVKPVNFQSFTKVTPLLSCQWALLGTHGNVASGAPLRA